MTDDTSVADDGPGDGAEVGADGGGRTSAFFGWVTDNVRWVTVGIAVFSK